VVLGAWAASLAGAEPRQAPNSRIAIDLASSFTPSGRFSGFVDEASGASFVIIEMAPRAYEELKGMPDRTEVLAAQGLREVKRKELPGRSGDYVYFNGKQTAGESEIAKFVLILREGGVTAMISANIPQKAIEAGTFTREQVERILAGAAVKDKPAESAELFRFRYLGPLKQAFYLAGPSKTYNLSGASPSPDQNRLVMEPMLFVEPSLDGRQLLDPKAMAERYLRAFSGPRESIIKSEKSVEIGGLKGYQIIGEAAEAATGGKVALNLVLLSGTPDGHYAILGTVPLADRDKFMPELQKVIESFELVRP
jgi:hypothetical protein